MLRTYWKAVCAGAAIGLGCLVNLSCSNRAVGAALFSIGLIAVLIFKLELITGRVCYVRRRPQEWPMVWLGNVVGAVWAAWIARADATAVVADKLSKPLLGLFLDGAICGALIAVSVMGYHKTKSLIVPILGVMGFVMAGAEHCVADAFYFAASGQSPVKEMLAVTVGNVIGGGLMGVGIENLGDGAM